MTETTEAAETNTAEATEPQSAALPHPRIRIGAVLWGVVVIATAAVALSLQTAPARLQAVLDRAEEAGPLGVGVVVLVVTGGVIVLIAASSLVRRAQLRRGGSD